MAKKGKYDFNRFTDFYGSIDLYTQTIRKTWEFDLLDGVNQFEAIVLTEPIPADLSLITSFFGLSQEAAESADSDQQQKYFFQARIVNKLSPHQFLQNPCNINLSTTIGEQANIQDSLQLHTTVFGYSLEMKPVVGDYVKIKLQPGEFVYNLKNAILVEKLTNLSPQAKAVLDQQRKTASANLASSKSAPTSPPPKPAKKIFKRRFKGSTVQSPSGQELFGVYHGQEIYNGRIPDFLLEPLPPGTPWSTSRKVAPRFLPEVIPSLVQLLNDYKAHFGEPLSFSYTYRDFEGQIEMKKKYGGGAATPGQSNHGWGVAFDVNGTRTLKDGTVLPRTAKDKRFDSEVYEWLDNGGKGRYGWINPPKLRRGKKGAEAWHWENTQIRDEVIKNRRRVPPGSNPEAGETEPEV